MSQITKEIRDTVLIMAALATMLCSMMWVQIRQNQQFLRRELQAKTFQKTFEETQRLQRPGTTL